MSKPTLARELHLATLDDLLAEAKRIAAQPDATSRGAWTPAQNIWHVGRFIKAGVEGYPAKVPLILKIIGPLMKKRFTTKGFSPGIKLPSQAADHMVAPADTTIEQAMDMFETAMQGAKDKGFLPRNPMMGKMTQQQWVDLHCRHAEMHFGLIELKD
ncbi:MAG: DUF1569 domain-containing protein [Phycisphaeraceae bacterium]|nr:DUF1569 domain-containing protein [Phycisphaeraceae bacterium]